MYLITKQLKSFSAAHRLVKGYQGKCRHLHGHNYALEISFISTVLDDYDFVIDFDEIKLHFDNWVQTHWDHATLVSEIDTSLIRFLEEEKQQHFIIPGKKNTSAECLSYFLFNRFNKILDSLKKRPTLQLESVRVFESATASATYRASRLS